ncbi:LCP family protein required for cell wall assembly [Streptomyces sp. SAI-208]|uniref:LCP family protein n=1 Tax=unclassified Streptomyces TaxID=2593676 RepID=UPI0024754C65|nr:MULTISPECIES: LCP family protein [unclassified Streptomyces]MDH6518620.1 LCP family protein required for cell wall assembly [Streptomyces sp. SAI-090]MDH6550840.1 LCP family protein required for cell wall assembly [Streptomyces sp. SAI-041]MDH6569902.1 LCP family protein required for cell wall assembly [Streptomyces sp. SAI-117]MDH6585137.1 LCP family protein required for cell wall assembly [Streptomyces sp. SAI-133]MDH6609467.1 LCP family protein required for cell wall assembly [Streptomyc
MNDWPEGWSGDNRGDRYGRGSASAQPESARVMRQVRRGQAAPGQGAYGRQGPSAPPYGNGVPQQQPSYVNGQGHGGDYDAYDSGYNTGQVYGSPGGGGYGGPGDPVGGRGPRPAPNWRKRIKWTAIVVLTGLVVTTVSTYFWADSKLNREVDLSKVIDRPEQGDGTNYLIVGSDSRAGLSSEQKKQLHTGSAEGKRTDSMMILHTGSNGDTLISLPRDSDVEIPTFVGSESGKTYKGTGRHVKLNAAYAEDGPELLVRTVEFNTGLKIDHYVEIGFAGFANIVDAVGGVEIDIPKGGMKDTKSGADFEAGKQTLNGDQALAFVRTRYALAGSDLDRTKNQQKFLNALANQVATPSTVLNPFKLYPTMGAGLDSLIVDKDMGLYDLGKMFWAMKGVNGGDGTSMNMPISGSTGGNLLWDKAKVKTLVDELKNDEKVTVSGN